MNSKLCPYFGKCGGCSLSQDYALQLEEKQYNFESQLKALEPSVVIESPVSGPSEGYRSRARFRYSPAGLSFSEEHSNNQVILHSCPILVPELNGFVANPPKVNLWELKDGEMSCFAADKKVVWGSDMGWVTVNGKRLPVSGDVFFQSNLILLPKLIDYVVSHVSGHSVMDLYAGVGTFSAFLEDKFNVTAVEINKKCLSLARQHLKNTSFFASAVEKWNPKKHHVDTVIVDPPRVGLDFHVPAMIASWEPLQIIYVSCNPATQLRDISRLIALGYHPVTGKMFDFYPHTSHVETVVCMINQNAQAKHYVNVGIDAEEYYRIKDKKK